MGDRVKELMSSGLKLQFIRAQVDMSQPELYLISTYKQDKGCLPDLFQQGSRIHYLLVTSDLKDKDLKPCKNKTQLIKKSTKGFRWMLRMGSSLGKGSYGQKTF